MKNLIGVSILAFCAVTSAYAADLPARVAPAPAPAFVAYDWTGIYIGGQVGGASSRMRAADYTLPDGGYFVDIGAPGTQGFSFKKSAVVGGVFGGAQYQFGQIVVGVEASWIASDLNKRTISPYFPASDRMIGRIGDIVQVVGRVGYAFDRFLVYAKGGYAGADVTFRARDTVGGISYRQKDQHDGYAVGAGIDYAVMDSVIIGFDYTHIDLKTRKGTGPNVFDNGTFGNFPNTYRIKAEVDTYMARISYKY